MRAREVGQAQLLFVPWRLGGGAFCEAKDYDCLLLLQNTKSGGIFFRTGGGGREGAAEGGVGEFRRARAQYCHCAAHSAALCHFLQIFAKIGSSVVVKPHHNKTRRLF